MGPSLEMQRDGSADLRPKSNSVRKSPVRGIIGLSRLGNKIPTIALGSEGLRSCLVGKLSSVIILYPVSLHPVRSQPCSLG